ncbi:hypothetical protein P8625_11290 [Tenacibaculum tangerinum]|uniref:Uncharacterized protein n=1 Tax=Tenacibaculum tangerinum TaxID=3038772 RepID=A0ABY8L386_9FLAO|nr:hypothetical protein [Tenacibaculum tangerinum]WGH74668.1 hypothetical protein P8625_11290 [Tenacibaculum tangerinum]
MKQSIEALRYMEMTKVEQLNVMAKGGGVVGKHDTDGEENCKKLQPFNSGEYSKEKLRNWLEQCIDIDLPLHLPVVKF